MPIDEHCVNYGGWWRGAVARMCVLAYEMWLDPNRSQGQLGVELYPRFGLYSAGRRVTMQPPERAAARVGGHEGCEPTTANGTGNCLTSV